jgi:protease PrsW
MPRWAIHPRTGTWRWWSGHHWTQYSVPGERRPALPPFLSVPVLVFLLLDVVLYLSWGIDVLLLGAAALPTLVVLAFLLALDRVEPEPAEGRWHALLWGMFVAGFVAAEVNMAVAGTLGEAAALLVAAPLGEELLKGAGVVWAVRRREVDDALDGAIYAGWIAVGFTIIEDYHYLVFGADEGALVETVLVRGVGTFAHPLFTVWIGIAVGRAVAERTDIRRAFLRGLAAAVGLHVAWNLATLLPIFWGVYVAFLALAAFTVGYLRRHEREFRHDVNGAAQLIARASAESPLSPGALRSLERVTDPEAARALRSGVGRRARRALDAERAATVRLVLRAHRAGIVYPAEILEINDHLAEIGRLAGVGAGPRPPSSTPVSPPPPPPPPAAPPAPRGAPRRTGRTGTPGWDPRGPGPTRPPGDVDPFG